MQTSPVNWTVLSEAGNCCVGYASGRGKEARAVRKSQEAVAELADAEALSGTSCNTSQALMAWVSKCCAQALSQLVQFSTVHYLSVLIFSGSLL